MTFEVNYAAKRSRRSKNSSTVREPWKLSYWIENPKKPGKQRWYDKKNKHLLTANIVASPATQHQNAEGAR
jgi:hypothetical protein